MEPDPHTAKPLHQSFAILVRGGHLPQPPRRAQDKGGKHREVIEKQDHA
jgi:hypothetical protein